MACTAISHRFKIGKSQMQFCDLKKDFFIYKRSADEGQNTGQGVEDTAVSSDLRTSCVTKHDLCMYSFQKLK